MDDKQFVSGLVPSLVGAAIVGAFIASFSIILLAVIFMM